MAEKSTFFDDFFEFLRDNMGEFLKIKLEFYMEFNRVNKKNRHSFNHLTIPDFLFC